MKILISLLFTFSVFGLLAQTDGPELELTWGVQEIQGGAGEVGIGKDTVEVTFTLKNIGNETLTISKIELSGTNSGDFEVVSGYTTDLDYAETGTLKIKFEPANHPNFSEVNVNIRGNFSPDFTFRINNKRMPVISWSNPADIGYGEKLTDSQLNASISNGISGDFTYNPDIDAQLQAGDNQALEVRFRPNNEDDYTSAVKTVYINVKKLPSSIEWDTPADIVYGTKLNSVQLNASAFYVNADEDTVAISGQFAYDPSEGTTLNVGTHTLTVSFEPSITNFATSSKSVTINVTKATPTITWLEPRSISYGSALGEVELDAQADVAGTFTYTPSAGTILSMGQNHELAVLFTPTDILNYTTQEAKVYIDVTDPSTPELQAHRIMLDYDETYGTEIISGNKFSISWTRGEGTACVVFVCQTDSGYAEATPGISYTPNSQFGNGTQIGTSGWYCVYDGAETGVTVTGLSPELPYRIMVLEYANVGTYKAYQLGEGIYNPRNFTTLVRVEENIIASNFLSADGNGANDTWYVGRVDELADFELSIFNNLGLVVYSAKPYDNTWNATSTDGKELPAGTYYYVFRSSNSVVKGYVTVVR